MNAINKTSRVLGFAFLLQFVTSFSSGVFLRQAWVVPGNIGETMINIASKPWLMRTNILVDMLTALGIIFLGAILSGFAAAAVLKRFCAPAGGPGAAQTAGSR